MHTTKNSTLTSPKNTMSLIRMTLDNWNKFFITWNLHIYYTKLFINSNDNFFTISIDSLNLYKLYKEDMKFKTERYWPEYYEKGILNGMINTINLFKVLNLIIMVTCMTPRHTYNGIITTLFPSATYRLHNKYSMMM